MLDTTRMAQGECNPDHDWFTALLTFGLCCGLIISYAPQHYRIISKGTSLGLSPWFLLLGSTSTAASLFNMVTLQWRVVSCCRVLAFSNCVRLAAGILQVGLQWILFTMILVLYMIYYPPELKYEVEAQPKRKRDEWRTAITLAWIVVVHFVLILGTTIYLLATTSVSPSTDLPHKISSWATFLGVSSAILAAIQYAPQLVYTYNIKLVGALSIPMMMIQTPGAILMILSIARRPSTNWTSWITFAVAGIMQGSLLGMCLAWKVRQRRMGIDDFGQPIAKLAAVPAEATADETMPLLRSGTA